MERADPRPVNLNDVKGVINHSGKSFQASKNSVLSNNIIWTKYGLQQLIRELQMVVAEMEEI